MSMRPLKLFNDDAKQILESQGLYEDGDQTFAKVKLTRQSVEGRTVALVEWVI